MPNTPRPNLPTNPSDFYRAGPDLDALTGSPHPTQHVLEQLGPPPFRKSNFPILGFLTTFYEHVSAHASGQAPPSEPG
jgi:hypothetical protein